jgi:hypothetical protein
MNTPPRTQLLASLTALFVIGAIIGLLTGYSLASKRTAQLPPATDFKEAWLETYQTELHLSPAQIESIRPLLNQPTEDLAGLWYRTLMTSGAIKESFDRKIAPLLTPEQRQDLLVIIQKNRSKRLAAAFNKITGSPQPEGIHYYAATGDTNKMLQLIQNGANPDELDIAFGMTPLALAAAHNQLPAAQLLLAHGANANATNADLNTALHSAAFFGRPQMVEFLLQQNANPQAKNKENKTPLESIDAPWQVVEFIAAILHVEIDPNTTPANRNEAKAILEKFPNP